MLPVIIRICRQPHSLLETLDTVFGSLLSTWDYENGLILLTSDHGNLEDLSTRRHTRNDVPLLAHWFS